MPGAFQDAEVGAPRSNFVAVLIGHDSRNLVKVREVVRGPRGEQIREGDDAESGVAAALLQFCAVDVKGAELIEISRSQLGKLIE